MNPLTSEELLPRRPAGWMLTGLTALTALATAIALLLTGCATPGPSQPAATMAAPQALGLQADTAVAFPADRWWQAFQQPELDALVERALAGNPNLKAAEARVRRAQAGVAGAEANERPSAQLSVEATRQRYTENGLIPPPLAGTQQNSGTVQVGGSWELDFFGRHREELQSAVGSERAAQAEAQAARVLLAANIARSYVQLAHLFELRDVAQLTLSHRQQLLELIRQRVQSGLDTNVELRQGEGQVPEIRQQLEQLDEQITLTRHALAALTGQPPDALALLAPRLQPVQAVAVPAVLPADLLGRRADIAAARWRAEAATHDVAAARAQFYPSVNLTAFVGFNAFGLDRVLDFGSRQYGAGPALSLPLFDAGRLRAQHQGRQAERDAAIESYNATVLDAVHDAADQIASLQAVQRQQREQAVAQAAAESAFDLAVQRYRAGLASFLTVLTAENNVLAQRRGGADLKARALDLQVALARALGGGYVAPQAQALAAVTAATATSAQPAALR
jgi:NodT family efflux transporter outer membrane factor (OMF) lipoprotein